MIWNMPFEITYRSMNPFGWPQLVLTCINKNSEGAEYVKAFGSIHIPVSPGHYTKTVRMFSLIQEPGAISELLGINPLAEGLTTTISNPQAIANADGRQYSKVQATGKIVVSLNVLQRNMGRHGYTFQ